MRRRSSPAARRTALIGLMPLPPSCSAATAAASCSASGADRFVIDVPNSNRESNSSCGNAGTLAKVISGFTALPVTRIVAFKPVESAFASISSAGLAGVSPANRMMPRSSWNSRPANS